MGMLMHNTIMKQIEGQKPVAEKEPAEKANTEPEAEPVKKTGGRRKVK